VKPSEGARHFDASDLLMVVHVFDFTLVRAPGSPGEFERAEGPVKALGRASVGMTRVHAARFGPRTRGVRE
jgi:hypothetical protein